MGLTLFLECIIIQKGDLRHSLSDIYDVYKSHNGV